MIFEFVSSQMSHKGNVREANEDSCAIEKTINGTLFIVCDGMGGAVGGKKASAIAVSSTVDFFKKEAYNNLHIALYKSIQFANEQVYATAQVQPQYKGMGTTVCAILIKDENIYIAHVGDSRIYLISDKKIYPLTKDHSYVNQLYDNGIIKEEELKTHPEKNRILKAVGTHSTVEPAIPNNPLLLKKSDQLLICSDGLTDMVSEEAILQQLNLNLNIENKAEKLIKEALRNGGKDNVTVQLIEVTDSPHKKSSFTEVNLAKQEHSEKKGTVLKKTFIKIFNVIVFLSGLAAVLYFSGIKEPDNINEKCVDENGKSGSGKNTGDIVNDDSPQNTSDNTEIIEMDENSIEEAANQSDETENNAIDIVENVGEGAKEEIQSSESTNEE